MFVGLSALVKRLMTSQELDQSLLTALGLQQNPAAKEAKPCKVMTMEGIAFALLLLALKKL